jgi:hypothetical protein
MADNIYDHFDEEEVEQAVKNRRRRQLASFTDDGVIPDSKSFLRVLESMKARKAQEEMSASHTNTQENSDQTMTKHGKREVRLQKSSEYHFKY